ncbi:MAG: hypothetical protein J6Y99_03245 [Bacteroidales bacterium]|nr:hypothetical protein [Bacteroidales bacterium]
MAYYSDNQIEEAWNRATTIEGANPNEWRKDPCGAWIKRDQYGKESRYGWNIDHIIPKKLFQNNGYDCTSLNRWPMHWKNNNSKADYFPRFPASVISDGTNNVEVTKNFILDKFTIDSLLNAKEITGLNAYIQSCEQEWIEIYGKEQVQKWISSNPV